MQYVWSDYRYTQLISGWLEIAAVLSEVYQSILIWETVQGNSWPEEDLALRVS